MEALKLCLRGSSGSAQAEPGATAAVPNLLEQPPQHSLQGELLRSFPAVERAWYWCQEFASGATALHAEPYFPGKGWTALAAEEGSERGAWWARGINQGQPPTSVQGHPSPFSPPTRAARDSICPQGKQTEHCTAFHSVPKSEVVSAFYLFHKHKKR